MASRSSLVAALALFALLAAAATAQPGGSRPPIKDPCDGNLTVLAEAMTNATNAQLAKSYGKSNTTSKSKSASVFVPKICGPFGTCVGDKTYATSAGSTKTTTGATNVTSTWTMTQTACGNSSGTWVASGKLGMALAWFSPISSATTWDVKGFLGVDLDFSVSATITGLAATVPGIYTLESTNGVTGTITAVAFDGCTVTIESVVSDLGGTNLPTVLSKVQEQLKGSGPELCDSLNKKLAPPLIGRQVPLG